MKEIQNIIKRSAGFSSGDKAILATVVDVIGSGYRRPGARMLIDENGYSIGTVSGGCLEADVLERAKKVLQTNEPIVITYDTTQDENSVFGLSMGCRGIVRILLEPFTKENLLINKFQQVFTDRKPMFVATIVSSDKESDIGGRIFYSNDDQFHFVNSNETLQTFAELKTDIRSFFERDSVSEMRQYKIGDSSFEIFFENINPPLNLLLFGVGYDAIPLIKFAKEIGWRVTAIDHRPAFANAERLPEAEEIIVSNSEDLSDAIFNDENSVGVIMTHNYERDRNILRRLLDSKCKYIGALGPKKRTEKLLEEIGDNFSAEQLSRLHAPVGLDIGASSPEAIALSIAAEIQSVLSERGGGFLRNRKGSIYARD